MQGNSTIDNNYLQVRRVMALIAYANEEIDEEERQFLASNIGKDYRLSEEQICTLLDDACKKTAIEDTIAEITEPVFLRLLITELTCLAVAKEEWEEAEISMTFRAIDAIKLSQEGRDNIKKIFQLLLNINSLIGGNN